MNPVNKKAVENMLATLERYRIELNDMQEQEESEFIDQALDDIEMIIEDLRGAIIA